VREVVEGCVRVGVNRLAAYMWMCIRWTHTNCVSVYVGQDGGAARGLKR